MSEETNTTLGNKKRKNKQLFPWIFGFILIINFIGFNFQIFGKFLCDIRPFMVADDFLVSRNINLFETNQCAMMPNDLAVSMLMFGLNISLPIYFALVIQIMAISVSIYNNKSFIYSNMVCENIKMFKKKPYSFLGLRVLFMFLDISCFFMLGSFLQPSQFNENYNYFQIILGAFNFILSLILFSDVATVVAIVIRRFSSNSN